MKELLLLCSLVFSYLLPLAQSPKIKWGEEFKLKKGSTDLEVIYSDNSGVYVEEGHSKLKTYFVIGATMRVSATLVKLDKNLNEIYRNDFNKELKGKEFVQFFMLQGKMYLIASEYTKSSRSVEVFGAEVNMKSGEMAGMWKPLTTFIPEGKKDKINFKITVSADSTNMVIVSSIEGNEKNEYKIQEFNQHFKAASKPVTIRNEFDTKTYKLEDVVYTTDKKIILVGRVYEYQEGKKKKEKFLDFANYNIRIYDESGKQQTELNTNINGKWLTSAKLMQEKNNDLVLAAFYNNHRKGKTIDGLLVQRIESNTGKIVFTSENPINNSLLSTNDNEADSEEEDVKETKAERKEREALDKIKDEGEAFSKFMRFRNLFYSSDNSVILLAEHYRQYTYTTYNYAPSVNGMAGGSTSTTHTVYECGDLLVCKINKEGKFEWLQVLPKYQREVIPGYLPESASTGFFQQVDRPFYAGFGAMQKNNTINIFFNDHPKNALITQPGLKVKTMRRFGKSDCFHLSVNESTGKITRKMFFSNSDMPVAMPRLSSVVGDNMYLIGKEDRVMGKSKTAVARITL